MTQPTTPPDEFAADPVEEELVAYLDGELDAESARQLEERLARDTELRERLARLQATWDLLDSLPGVQADAVFTQTTMSMVALDTRRNTGRRSLYRRLAWSAAAVAGLFLAALAGYRTIDYLASGPEQQLARDLPVIERVDLYLVADSVEFLRRLADERLFDQEATHAP